MTTDNGESRTAYQHPWLGTPDGVVANIALADLINNLPLKLTVDGQLHAETLLAAIGAIAGYTAQRALLSAMPAEAVSPANGFQVVQTTSGDQFLFGEPLDRTLLPLSPADPDKLWVCAASGAISAGLDPNSLPPIAPMFAHVAKTLGSPTEGSTSVEGCVFQAPPKDILKALWPFVLMCFNGQISGKAMKAEGAVSQRWRPVIAALAANRMIRDTAHVVPPLKALTIVMETAIYTSKFSPSMVEPTIPRSIA
jgi:hypothetical protein